jgi:tryptophanyl-tRNA synthetase
MEPLKKSPEENPQEQVKTENKDLKAEKEFILNPNNFQNDSNTEIDYEKIVKQFGCKVISDELLERMEKLTGKRPHRFLTRGIFFSHRYN